MIYLCVADWDHSAADHHTDDQSKELAEGQTLRMISHCCTVVAPFVLNKFPNLSSTSLLNDFLCTVRWLGWPDWRPFLYSSLIMFLCMEDVYEFLIMHHIHHGMCITQTIREKQLSKTTHQRKCNRTRSAGTPCDIGEFTSVFNARPA